MWEEWVRKWEAQNGTLYCLASRNPEGSEVLANHFVLCRFSSLKHVGVLYGFPSPPSFLFSGCFLSGLNWIQEQTRAQESAVIIQHECVSGSGESRIEGSGGRKLFPFLFLSLHEVGMTQCPSWRAVVAEMVSDMPMFPRDPSADRWVGFLPLTSTEANYERNGEGKNKQNELKSMGGAARWGKQGSKSGKCNNKTVRYRKYLHGGQGSKRSCAQLSLGKMLNSFLTLFSCWSYLPRPAIDTARLLACWMLSVKLICLLMSH